MKSQFLAGTTLAISALTLPAAALADVTPADVWGNYGAYIRALGGELTATLSDDGNSLAVNGIAANFALPMRAGSVSMTMGSVKITDNGDGTATLRAPTELPVSASFDIAGVGQGRFGMVIRSPNYEMLATGTPGDVSYSYGIASYTMEFTDLTLSGPAFEDPKLAALSQGAIRGSVTVDGNTGNMRVTEGDLLRLTFEGGYSGLAYDFTFGPVQGVTSSQQGSMGAGDTSGTVAMPATGVAVMALPQALRDGMEFHLSSRYTDAASFQQVKLGDKVQTSTRDFVELAETEIHIDAGGLRLNGTGEGYSVEITGNEFLPVPITAAVGKILFGLDLPLLASETPQPVAYRLSLGDVTVGEEVWGLVDQAGALPHDPATVDLDLTGQFLTKIDLLDFMALAAIEENGEIPFEMHELNINNLLAVIAGAELTGNGGFTFDNSDLATFGGMPAPTGSLDLNLTGGNTLLDALVAMGLLPEEDAMSARMMLGMFSQPGEGPDTLTSKIEIDGATGAISANGRRLQ
ncbi:MAG: DUF2125 domain-containing protein [Rhodobacteraceae bacterium]|nr:DUF2125 domain-containing protein [Paracoccaceae bacterium]